MKGHMKVNRPDEVEVMLILSLKISEWRELRNQLNQGWPSWELSKLIGNLLDEVDRTFCETQPPGTISS